MREHAEEVRHVRAAKRRIIEHAHRLDGEVVINNAVLRENYRSHTSRINAARSRAELNGILRCLGELDGRYGEGIANTARRYGLKSLEPSA